MTGPLLVLVGTFFGLGLVLVGAGLGLFPLSAAGREVPAKLKQAPAYRSIPPRDWAIAGILGLVALAVTRWPMSVPLAVLAVLGVRGVTGGSAKKTIERLEAIAAWTEMLRDTLAGAAGLTQALVATSTIAPRPLRGEVGTMAARLNAGVPIETALAQMADEIADPAADTVVACLVLAATERAQKLADLLGALASSTREEVATRLGVEASRSAARTAVRMITGFSFGLLALMAVFARAYLSPYTTASGQVVLGAVGCIYGVGLWLMAVMVRSRPFPRLSINYGRLQ